MARVNHACIPGCLDWWQCQTQDRVGASMLKYSLGNYLMPIHVVEASYQNTPRTIAWLLIYPLSFVNSITPQAWLWWNVHYKPERGWNLYMLVERTLISINFHYINQLNNRKIININTLFSVDKVVYSTLIKAKSSPTLVDFFRMFWLITPLKRHYQYMPNQ